MWECECGREPLDYRLIWLRFLRRLWVIPVAVLIGTMLVGAAYFYSRTAARGGRTYEAESIFYINFAKNSLGEEYDYYNYFTWGEVIHTDFFLDYVYEEMKGEYSLEELASYITATVESDARYLYVRCNTHFPELSVKLASAMETIVPQFAEIRDEFESIEIAKKGDTAKDSSKIRLENACFLGVCLSLSTAVLIILAVLILDTSVYLPSTIEKRYHVVCLGTPFLPEFAPNWQLYLKDALKVALVRVDESDSSERFSPAGDGGETSADGKELMELDRELIKLDRNFMRYLRPSENIVGLNSAAKPDILICPNPVEHPGELEKIRNCDKAVLCLRAGRKNHETFIRLLEQLGRQGIPVTAAILISADEKLISAYYRRKE